MILSFEVKDIGKQNLKNSVVHEANEPLLENLERAYIQLDIDEEEAIT
jgi:hypothetical protein